ncbi:ATP-dependent helicase HrpA [Nitzschia inconspicua]|uniref:ATP-dependent helicase HrpA n=1 Tax=Nitzschia inconspicua TaxID=303405 RepID=A0A9K3PPS9_9STRA|nr:ATP-dependent helicase HrpA [Nitzschia inconspicua]
MSSQNIKGGGRAVLSDDCRQSIIRLLMDLYENDGNGTPTTKAQNVSSSSSSTLSMHQQQREERRFVKRLVQRYERSRLANQYNSYSSGNDNVNGRVANPDNLPTKMESLSVEEKVLPQRQPIATGKVRLEIAEAVFHGNNDDKNGKKKGKASKSSNRQQSLPFQSSAKKVMVLARATTIPELCQQAKAKLKSKASLVRAFVVEETASSSSSVILVDLKTDLSGISDGTTVYVTTANDVRLIVEGKNPAENQETTSNEPEDNFDRDDASDQMGIDPLEQVKQAYATMNNKRQPQNDKMDSKSDDPILKPIIDAKMVEKWASTRAFLPASSCKSIILSATKSHPVVILSGATGSGKSTQVPQFLYEDQQQQQQQQQDGVRLERPYIVATQPRRVAAISLAQRVAEEMGSPPPGSKGSSVGYIVRLDRRVAEDTCRIIFCTVGVVLRMLVCPKNEKEQSNGSADSLPSLSLDTISHLILDEVHERDVNTDFSLTILRGLLASKQHPQLRMILMSATASADFFVNYFSSATSNPPITLEIPGRAFPVQTNWLSSCERTTGTTLRERPCNEQYQTKVSSQHENGYKNEIAIGKIVSSPRALQKIDNNLICALISKIVKKQQSDGELTLSASSSKEATKYRQNGGILVFLPGKAEIEALSKRLFEDRELTGDRNFCQVLKLYSSMPRGQQERVFRPAMSGTVKIVLATNVAETSVTIPDVSHVIDTGRVKESRFNASTRIKELVTVWTSQASAKQRSGRAGRTSAGTCWRLYSEDFFNNEMTVETAPEMVRTPLDELILQICLLYENRRDEHLAKTMVNHGGSGSNPEHVFAPGVRPIQFLSKTPSPPPIESLIEGCNHLLEVDALRIVEGKTQDESCFYRLTALGYHLSRLPMDAKVGKVLIVGCILGCLDGALTVAAALSCTKSCFVPLVNSNQDTPNIVKEREFVVENGFGGRTWPGGTVKGDLIAVIAVYRAWKTKKSESQRWKFCKSHGLDVITLKELDQLRTQFLELLRDAGIIPKGVTNECTQNRSQSWDDCNHSSEDALLTSCCLIAGLYPNICTLMRPRKGGPRGGRLLTKEGDVCRPSFGSFQHKRVKTASEAGRDVYGVYHGKQTIVGAMTGSSENLPSRRPDVFLTEVNFVSRFALLLFGGGLEIVKNAIIVDGWLKFKIASSNDDNTSKFLENAALILSLRQALEKVVLDHILETNASAERKLAMMERHKAIIQVVRQLLAEEGS